MSEIPDNTVQFAMTSLPDNLRFVARDEDKGADMSREVLYSRTSILDRVFPFIRPMTNEIYRVLKPDGCFVFNAGSVVRDPSPGLSLLMPLVFAEYVVNASPLSFQMDFIIEQKSADGLVFALGEEFRRGVATVHQHMLAFAKGTLKPRGESPIPSIWHYMLEDRLPREDESVEPNGFPITVVAQLLKLFSDEGDTVLDPCAGLGTLGYAATRMNRNAILYEIRPELIPVIQRNVGTNLIVEQP